MCFRTLAELGFFYYGLYLNFLDTDKRPRVPKSDMTDNHQTPTTSGGGLNDIKEMNSISLHQQNCRFEIRQINVACKQDTWQVYAIDMEFRSRLRCWIESERTHGIPNRFWTIRWGQSHLDRLSCCTEMSPRRGAYQEIPNTCHYMYGSNKSFKERWRGSAGLIADCPDLTHWFRWPLAESGSETSKFPRVRPPLKKRLPLR